MTFRLARFAVSVALILLAGGLAFFPLNAAGKRPGGLSCYQSVCWRVPTLAQLRGVMFQWHVARAAYSQDPRRGQSGRGELTSSGEPFEPNSLDRVSSPNLPNGTKLLIWSPINGQTAHVIVNNTGPFWRKRLIDVSPALAEALGFRRRGAVDLYMMVVDTPSLEAVRYAHRRSYPFRGGLMGVYRSTDMALRAYSRRNKNGEGRLKLASAAPALLSFSDTQNKSTPPPPKRLRVRPAKRDPASQSRELATVSPQKKPTPVHSRSDGDTEGGDDPGLKTASLIQAVPLPVRRPVARDAQRRPVRSAVGETQRHQDTDRSQRAASAAALAQARARAERQARLRRWQRAKARQARRLAALARRQRARRKVRRRVRQRRPQQVKKSNAWKYAAMRIDPM